MRNPVKIFVMTRNDGFHVRKCIASIVDNTYYPYEIIIVDNNSNDGVTKKVIKDLMVEYSVKIKFTENNKNKWIVGLNGVIGSVVVDGDPFFVLTDGDVAVGPPDSISGECWLSTAVRTFLENPWIGKLGLSIDLDPIKGVPSMKTILAGEEFFYCNSLTPDVYLAQVDTTIAIYRSNLFIHDTPNFYPGHNSYIKPYYHVGRLKKHICTHLGWENYGKNQTQKQINEKVICFTKYCGYINDIVLREASFSARMFHRFSILFRLYWGGRLLLCWIAFLVRKKIINLNELLQAGKSKY